MVAAPLNACTPNRTRGWKCVIVRYSGRPPARRRPAPAHMRPLRGPSPVSMTSTAQSPTTKPTLGTIGTRLSGITNTPSDTSTGSPRTTGGGSFSHVWSTSPGRSSANAESTAGRCGRPRSASASARVPPITTSNHATLWSACCPSGCSPGWENARAAPRRRTRPRRPAATPHRRRPQLRPLGTRRPGDRPSGLRRRPRRTRDAHLPHPHDVLVAELVRLGDLTPSARPEAAPSQVGVNGPSKPF
jgi:hypothetical protein